MNSRRLRFGLNDNVAHRLLNLKSNSPGCHNVWARLLAGESLEKVCHFGQTLRGNKKPQVTSVLTFYLGILVENVISQLSITPM